eukprot:m.488513 g.488513  ORF g.488513 m.488513 type:complete len:626 (-) comp25839_c0_seq1:227-2104(-)
MSWNRLEDVSSSKDDQASGFSLQHQHIDDRSHRHLGCVDEEDEAAYMASLGEAPSPPHTPVPQIVFGDGGGSGVGSGGGGGGGRVGAGSEGAIAAAAGGGGGDTTVHARLDTLAAMTTGLDPSIDVTAIAEADLARQLTLLDLECFLPISHEELRNGAWMRKDKFEKAANVVAFTRRFNHTSFWVTREVLHSDDNHHRAAKISHFIRTCRKLLELNNLHSLLAILSSLQSAPIYRLTHTWALVGKESKHFQQLKDLMSEQDNHKALREHMASCGLPCIPHLGLWLMDIVHLSCPPARRPATTEEHNPSQNDHDQREGQIEHIIAEVGLMQKSEYNFEVDPAIRAYLTSIKYAEELQKMMDAKNFKLSLEIEPRRGEDDSDDDGAAGFGTTTAAMFNKLASLALQPKSSLPFRIKTPSKRHGHRKSKSLTGQEFSGSREMLLFEPPDLSARLVESRSSSAISEQPSSDGDLASMLDCDFSEEHSDGHSDDDSSRISMTKPHIGFMAVDHEGPLYRRSASRVTLGRKKKQWAVLSASTLHLYSSGKRADSMAPQAPCASLPLAGATVAASTTYKAGFTLRLPDARTLRFVAGSEATRSHWIDVLRAASATATANSGHVLHHATTNPL